MQVLVCEVRHTVGAGSISVGPLLSGKFLKNVKNTQSTLGNTHSDSANDIIIRLLRSPLRSRPRHFTGVPSDEARRPVDSINHKMRLNLKSG